LPGSQPVNTYIVGDIQGCYDALRKLLDSVEFDPKYDRLWSVGDIVNRGPDSLSTIRYLKNLGPHFKMVLGNHDLHLLALARHKKSPKKGDTIDKILVASDREEIINWLRHQPLVYQQENSVLVHAGIPHIWPLQKTLDLASEVHRVLQSDDYEDFLSTMYGNEPNRWSDQLQGPERLRVITNYLTRMRICKSDGTLDLSFKLSPDHAPKHYLPWFAFYPEKPALQYDIYFGHWAALPSKTYNKHFHALDSGYFWGGELTLLRLADKKRFVYRNPR
jgi:bis(5'-nucleosyl)-tetraphosphatase (symmetrical)